MDVTGEAKASLQPFVDRLTIRSILNEEERQAILALPTQEVLLRSRLDYLHVNEETSHAALVVSGMIARFGQTSDGARQLTAFHLPGDMADLLSAVRPIGIGGMNALCETVILRVPHAAIRALAARYPSIAEALWRDCMLDAAILMEWVVNVGRRNAQTRIAHIFCEMAIRAGHNRKAVQEYAFPVTQEQLGDAASLTGVHVNRTLRALRDVVTLINGTVRIHDWAKLTRVGDFDATYLTADTGPDQQKRLPAAA
ncbi:Crp/Fnr family transcriptional regulator [Sphingomonas endolithica]|uniref:Crp/Fnr family transcriptional regulator n=1 Tax=Sphingomonas endolithica TaxID=2972485 RepID=UPI0021AE52F2|nr:Crp/Fnr family transcriptional regulator [Sphingomonas sp. ZFBP2030]